jgi:hypothetical protein
MTYVFVLVAEYHGDHRVRRLLEREAADAEVMLEPVIQFLESVGPLIALAARVHDEVVARHGDVEPLVEFVLLATFG